VEQQERFGARLRRYRESAGYSQEELAERAGLSANAISALERGERKRPYPDTLRRLAEALGLSAEARSGLASALHPSGDDPPAPVSATLPSPGTSDALPGDVTPLIGREHEADVVRHLLTHSEGRLLTLTGPGGVGKTRLALHVARIVSDHYPEGVVWVELAPLVAPELVLPTIARSLGLQEGLSADLTDTLHTYLRGRHTLVVLDNFEHVLEAAAGVAELLRVCHDLTLLVTSRAPLNIRGEQEYMVPPLELPITGHEQEPAEVARVPSVQLFVWQARQKDPAFALTRDNAAEVAAICRRLDGVPLALELAAARVKLLGTAELLARLDRALPVLTGGARDLPTRQRTMEAAITWSYDLLGSHEQALFRRLSVFAGGWMLEAAEAIATAPGDVEIDALDGMAVLVNHSLVRQVERPDGARRFTMLETFRQFGRARLDETRETAVVQRAHLEWYLALAETAETGLVRGEQVTWLARLDAEHDNLRAALGAGLETGDEAGLRLAGALWRFWWWHGHFTEGRAWLEQILARRPWPVSGWRAKALMAAGILAREQGEFAHAVAHLEASLAIRRELEDRVGIAQSLNNLGLVASYQGDFAQAIERYDEALGLYRELGDPLGIANVTNNLGIVAREQGEFARAAELYTESLASFRALGERRGVANTLHNLARVTRDRGDLARAVELYEESLAIERELGARLSIAMTLNHLGNVAREQGNTTRAVELYEESLVIRAEFGDRLGCVKVIEDIAALAVTSGYAGRAVRLYGAAAAERAARGTPVAPADRERYEHILAQARRELPADVDQERRDAGQAASLEQAVEEALAFLREAATPR